MTTRRTSRFVQFVLLCSMLLPSALAVRAEEQPAKIAKPLAKGSVVLFPGVRERRTAATVPDFGRSAFSFEHAERSDVRFGKSRHDFELFYGTVSLDGDSDWIHVETAADERSRIRNLGKREWSELNELPEIEPNDQLYGLSFAHDDDELEKVSHGTVAKAREGHIYLLRTKDANSDLVTALRIDQLVPGRSCHITWRLIENRQGLGSSRSETK